MADIANIKVGDTTYSIKDSTARTTASIVGNYTEPTETLEITLELGGIS